MRHNYFIFLLFLAAALLSCAQPLSEDVRFEQLANRYIEKMIEMNPEWATELGDHRYDHRLNDYSMENIAKNMTHDLAYLDSLKTFDPAKLNDTNKIDYALLVDGIKAGIFDDDTVRAYEWAPGRYNPGGAIYTLLINDFAPLAERLKSVKGRLQAVPGLLEQAKTNLKNPPKIQTETALIQIKGTINLVKNDLNAWLDSVPEMKAEIEPVQKEAVAALETYAEWLAKDLLPRSNGDFRIGEDMYRRKMHHRLQTDLTMEDILRMAEEEMVATQEEIYQTALPLYKQYFPKKSDSKSLADRKKVVKAVLDRMAEDHPDAGNIVECATACLKEAEDFVRDKELVTLPGEPVEVVIMPEFERGFAVAYCESPGPLEKGQKTFYSISPPPSDWDANQVTSYFREYNNTMLYDLTVHEAMPGHYLQAAHANQFKAPTLVRVIYGSGPFSEGWATYSEQVMVAAGFGGPELKMQMLKMRLRMLINAIIDRKIHTAGMTEQEAMDMMMNEGYQEQGEAAGKWRRACLSSVQLSSYYVGNIEINRIRKDYQAKMGDRFNMKEFHDKLLSYGTPPPKYVRQMMGI
ncbi:MAG: DUF885 domain-containing protein [candidate division Zixibacteria bacterium HGW-Zixibacteria-1]|nr:MAG: DUF885 domain-containing protein [candidate division Zixibacteria bacterium HGW-Zixibacteria-1]